MFSKEWLSYSNIFLIGGERCGKKITKKTVVPKVKILNKNTAKHNPCYRCGILNFRNDCPFKIKKCLIVEKQVKLQFENQSKYTN